MQYFSNMQHNQAASDFIFVEVVKVTNRTGLEDSELTWDSPRATYQIYSEQWPWNLLDLAWSLKFL